MISERAKKLALDLHNEARLDIIWDLIQRALDEERNEALHDCGNGACTCLDKPDILDGVSPV